MSHAKHQEKAHRKGNEELQPKAQKLSTQPGHESEMQPAPQSFARDYVGSGKLQGKVAVITGGDSGIGRSTAISFVKEGATVVIAYLNEHEDAKQTQAAISEAGGHCLALAGDVGDPEFVREIVRKTVEAFGSIDVLVNNAAEQHPEEDIADITREQVEKTFRTNFFGLFDLCREALPHMRDGGTIINTASVTAYRGSAHLLDYASTKGAIVAFTRSFAKQVAERKIRVNAVAPGPVWTPLIPSTFEPSEVAEFGKDSLFGRPAQPDEISPSFVFLACSDSSFITGQVLHPNGGEMVNA